MKRRIYASCTCNQYEDYEPVCCQKLKQMLNDCRFHMVYDCGYNEYGFSLIAGRGSYQPIDYCPWCGTKFPERIEPKKECRLSPEDDAKFS